MRVTYHVETDINNPQSLVNHCVASHNKWIKTGVNELKNDLLLVFTFQDPIIYCKIDDETEPFLPNIRKLGRGVNKVYWRLKEPYPSKEKHNASFILCSNQATIGIFYFGATPPQKDISDEDYNLMERKANLVPNAIKRSLLTKYKEEDLERKQETVRDDLLLKNKKICGFDYMEQSYLDRPGRFDFSCGIQNRYGKLEKKEIGILMFNDPHWTNSHGAKIGIGGANLNIETLILELQKEVDEIYDN